MNQSGALVKFGYRSQKLIANVRNNSNQNITTILYLPVSLQQNSDGTSTMVVNHYYQIMISKQFRQYDYGSEKNMEIYGNTFPPLYDFSRIKVPIALLLGQNDQLAVVEGYSRHGTVSLLIC
ncbi:hypothetical protein JTB14_037747 [Gonioctena quinquepunctata]|nr:hypothetical protein JTB14_037747 [Gonioctena quinquepunctata]